MGSLSGLFDLSRNALAADQAALNATANNVANQNTVGYTRESVSFTAGDSVQLSGGTTITSTGPIETTASVRDRVLEQRVQQQTQAVGATGARSTALAQIENVFSLTGGSATAGSTAIGTALDSLFSSLTALAGSTSDATQQGVLSAASTLASTFNTASSQLQTVGTTLNGQIASSVTQVNALTTTIAGLNQQIGSLSPGTDAGSLEDKRQLAIAQLSQYVGLDQITTEKNGITLTTQGGQLLVSGDTSSALTAVTLGGATKVLNSSGIDVSAGIQGGSIGGQLTAQNTDLPAVTSALDGLAYRVATAINTQNAAGTDTSGNAGTAIFNIPATASGAAGTISVISSARVASAGAGEGVSGTTNANALADIATATDASGQTMSGNLAALLAQVGSASSSVTEQNTAQQASLTQLTTQRDSLSAVSLDEEASNLSQFQKSYQAAARVLTVLDSLMASAINMGTETAVS